MDGWYAEKQYFKDGVYPDVTTDITKTVGHYTQMVASNTTEVGCGLNTSNTYNKDFLVCRYYPQGNVQGKRTLYPRQSYSNISYEVLQNYFLVIAIYKKSAILPKIGLKSRAIS